MLRSLWFLGFLAIIVNLVTVAAVFIRHLDEFAYTPSETSLLEGIEDKSVTWNFRSNEIQKMVRDLEKEKDRLSLRESEVAKWEAQIKAEKGELERLKSEIESFRNDLSRRFILIEESEAKNLKILVTTYASMRADSVVAVMDEFDEVMVVKLLSLMKPPAVALIYEEMLKKEGDKGAAAKRVAHLSEKLRLLQKSETEKEGE